MRDRCARCPALRIVLAATSAAIVFALITALPVAAVGDINGLIDSIRNWVAGLLAALATLFLTLGGLRYLTAGGNQRAMEEGKGAIKSALIGYALAALSPMLVDILRKVLGT
jgi:cytochrome c biogenesis protein CcdA